MSKLPLNKDCFVTSITLAFLKKYGMDALEWDPLIVRDAFEGGFHMDKMPQRMFDKLNCGLTLVGTTLFTDSIEGFLSGVACMNNLVFNGSVAPFVTLQQCAWGVWEYININGDVDKDSHPTEKFAPTIVKYIQEAANLNGVLLMPEWLKFAETPKDAMPDMTGDVALFEQYMDRQQDYISDLNGYVQYRQQKLTEELQLLQKEGFIG